MVALIKFQAMGPTDSPICYCFVSLLCFLFFAVYDCCSLWFSFLCFRSSCFFSGFLNYSHGFYISFCSVGGIIRRFVSLQSRSLAITEWKLDEVQRDAVVVRQEDQGLKEILGSYLYSNPCF